MITETSLIDLERTYTTAEFEELASDGNFYELIEGKLHLSPATGDEHGRIRQRIARQLHRFDPSGKLGEDWQNTHFLISSTFEPAPDFAFVVANRVPPVRQGTVEVVPDLVVGYCHRAIFGLKLLKKSSFTYKRVSSWFGWLTRSTRAFLFTASISPASRYYCLIMNLMVKTLFPVSK